MARRSRSPRSAFLALGLVLAAALPARADPRLECPDGTQLELSACLARTEAAVDRALATALESVRQAAAELDRTTGRPAAAPALDRAQAAWAAYRDAQCAYVGSSYGGGSGTGQAIRACRIDLGRARTDQLLGPP
ncbi:MAG: lysozyme inhibitor LprI family protein [Geminicoccaceae bacterium]